MDDILAQDTQCVSVYGVTSETFKLRSGTAQGRRFSIHVTKGLLRWLYDEVLDALPTPPATVLPPFARRALAEANRTTPPDDLCSRPTNASRLQMLSAEIIRIASKEQSPWRQTERYTVEVLSQLRKHSERMCLLDLLGSDHMDPVQFVDDISVACSSAGALRAVCSAEAESACSKYARRTKSKFNYSPGKTAGMSLGSAPIEIDVGCDVVTTRNLLGILVDDALTFKPLLAKTLATGGSLFEQFYYTAMSSGFSLPVAAAQVPLRIEPALLYAAALLAGVGGAETALNKLQVTWARRILGCSAGPHMKWSLLVAQCGWAMRLGTRMREKAIITHPTRFSPCVTDDEMCD